MDDLLDKAIVHCLVAIHLSVGIMLIGGAISLVYQVVTNIRTFKKN